MKRQRLLSLAVLVFGLMLLAACLGGCQSLAPAPSIDVQQANAQKLVDSVSSLNTTISTLQTTVKQVQAAATQPITVQAAPTPANPNPVPVTVTIPQSVQDSIEKAANKADQALTAAQQTSGAVQVAAKGYQDGLAKVAAAQDQQGKTVAGIEATVNTVANTIHAAAPGTPVDGWATIVQSLATVAVGLYAVHAGKQTAQSAITTPGTTPQPAAPPA